MTSSFYSRIYFNGVIVIVKLVICLVPLGIFGLVVVILVELGFDVLFGYLYLLVVLVGCMLLVVLLINLVLVYWKLCRNFYLLVFICLRESGIIVFFICSLVPLGIFGLVVVILVELGFDD